MKETDDYQIRLERLSQYENLQESMTYIFSYDNLCILASMTIFNSILNDTR